MVHRAVNVLDRDPRREHRSRTSRRAHRVRVTIALIAVGEVLADVPETGRPKQRVGHRVGQHVRVAVALQATLVRNLNAPRGSTADRDEPGSVVTDPDLKSSPARPDQLQALRGAASNTHSSRDAEGVEQLERLLVGLAQTCGRCASLESATGAPASRHISRKAGEGRLTSARAQARGGDLHRDPDSAIPSTASS